MSSLEGMYVDLNTRHPQEFVDAIYAEIVDQHPGAEEIDIIVQVDAGPIESQEDADSIDHLTVVDFRVFRVDKEWFGEYDGDDYNQRFKEMDAWGRSNPIGGDYIYLHTHPEGFPVPSGKDVAVVDILSSIDYARGEPVLSDDDLGLRRFVFAAVLNRDISFPISLPDSPRPIFDREIDLDVQARVTAQMAARYADHPSMPRFLELSAEFRTAMIEFFDLRDADDDEGAEAASARIKELGRALLPVVAEMHGVVVPDLQELVQNLRQALEGLLPPGASLSGGAMPQLPSGALGPDAVNDSLSAGLDAMRKSIEQTRGSAPEVAENGDVHLPPDGGDVPDVFRWVD